LIENDVDEQAVCAAAMKLLVRREHSRLELRHKLERKGCPVALIDRVLSSLEAEGALSDARFAELYASSRSERGYGPLRIRAELRERGVSEAVIDECLEPYRDAWLAQLARVQGKRFGRADDFVQRARQTRFFQARGYTAEQIRAVLKDGKTRA